MDSPEISLERRAEMLLAFRCSLTPPDDESWRQLSGRYRALLKWRVKKILPQALWEDAEDVVQEAFMRFHKVALGYQATRSSLASYLVVIAQNVARDWEKSSRTERSRMEAWSDTAADSAEARNAGAVSADFELDKEKLLARARRELALLRTPRTQKIFTAFLDGKSPQDLRKEHVAPQSTIYKLYIKYQLWLREIAAQVMASPIGPPAK